MGVSWPRLYVDQAAGNHPRTRAILDALPRSEVIAVSGERHPGGGLLITTNRGAFLKPCPGQKGSVCCGYWVVEWGLGCPLGCEYCVLQTYLPSSDMKLYVNWENCWEELRRLRRETSGPIRLGTGQFSDPLALESIFPFQAALARVVAELPDIYVEIKSKFTDLRLLRELGDPKRFIISFSLASESVIQTWEEATTPLLERLAAAREAQRLGFPVALHFDPIIPAPGWEKGYLEVFRAMREYLRPEGVRWISLGTFRFPPEFPRLFRRRPDSESLFAEELYPSFDGKLRFFRPFREQIYRFFWSRLSPAFPDSVIYLCMEASYVWARVTGIPMNSRLLKEILDAVVAG